MVLVSERPAMGAAVFTTDSVEGKEKLASSSAVLPASADTEHSCRAASTRRALTRRETRRRSRRWQDR